MGVPIVFLIIAPLAGIIALQLTPPFSSAAVILSLVFSACGLWFLYKYLLGPLRTLTTSVSQSGCKDIPAIDAACDLVRALEDSLRAQQTALKHAASEALAAQQELRLELQELRENRAVSLQAQQAVIEVLRKAQARLNELAVSLAASQDKDGAELWHDPQLFFKIAAELHHSERALLHAGQFWGEAAVMTAWSLRPPRLFRGKAAIIQIFQSLTANTSCCFHTSTNCTAACRMAVITSCCLKFSMI